MWRRARQLQLQPLPYTDPRTLTAIVALFEAWGEIDRSHRKLAHRGSYQRLVWVSPATVRRVLAAHGLFLRGPRRAGR